MDKTRRALFNAAYSDQRFGRMMRHLENRVGAVPFRVAETPLMMTGALRDRLVRYAREIVAQISEPALLERLKTAVPRRYDVPCMDGLPNTAQVDFALVQGADGELDGKLIELQGFPS